MGRVGDGASGVCDRTERGAMRGCGSCAASWNRKEVSVECEGRRVDDEADVPFACPGRNTTWGSEMSVGAVWRVTSGV
jgi:hypothetical protein